MSSTPPQRQVVSSDLDQSYQRLHSLPVLAKDSRKLDRLRASVGEFRIPLPRLAPVPGCAMHSSELRVGELLKLPDDRRRVGRKRVALVLRNKSPDWML